MNLSAIPTDIIAGDSYTVELAIDDYPVSEGWTGTLYLNGATTTQIVATTSSPYYLIGITSAKTSNLKTGTYAYAFAVSKSGEKHTVISGYLTVTDNLQTSGNKIIQTERILTAINDAIEGRITDDVQSLSIAGRSINLIPISELLDYRAIFTKELSVLKYGKSATRRYIPIQFGNL